MWQASGNCIRMTRNDFGNGLPLSFPETEISEEDTLVFTIKKESGPVLVRKAYRTRDLQETVKLGERRSC